VEYAAWPPPLTNLSRATLHALHFEQRGVAGADAAVRRLLALAFERRRAHLPPPVLLVAGGEWVFGLGNIITALASSAVLAESIGAACAFSIGEKLYASELRPFLRARSDGLPRMGAFPCADVGPSELKVLRSQRAVPVVGIHDWRAGSAAPPDGPFIIDIGYDWHEDDCVTRPDVGHLIVPPGMAPRDFWVRLRAKFEEFVFAAIELPLTDAEHRIEVGFPHWLPRQGTACGHMRLLHKENHQVGGGASCAKADCGGLLAALEILHASRPFSSYLFTAGANCSHCLHSVAPRLHREAVRIESAHFTKRIAAPNTTASKRNKSAAAAEVTRFDNAVGALLDMRALARCALVVVDDKPAGTFALSVAAAGRLAPCADSLAWLERRHPGYGQASLFGLVGKIDELASKDPYGLVAPPLRALCNSPDASSPPIPCAEPTTAEGWGRLADDVRYDLASPWTPRQLPRLYSTYTQPNDTSACRRRTRARNRRVQSFLKQQRKSSKLRLRGNAR
jgi:hypothetical protein